MHVPLVLRTVTPSGQRAHHPSLTYQLKHQLLGLNCALTNQLFLSTVCLPGMLVFRWICTCGAALVFFGFMTQFESFCLPAPPPQESVIDSEPLFKPTQNDVCAWGIVGCVDTCIPCVRGQGRRISCGPLCVMTVWLSAKWN